MKRTVLDLEKSPSKVLNTGLWIAQVLLSLLFIMAGIMKATQALDYLATSLPWVKDSSALLVRFIGVSELLGGIGILLPSILRIKPKLSVLAAIGLGLIMLFAMVFHTSRGETQVLGMNVVILSLALFVAWGRNKKAPILAKN